MSGKPVIDFDLAPKRGFPHVQSREQVLAELEAIRASLDSSGSAFHDLFRQRLTASITYLRVVLGREFGFEYYIENTLGLTPRLFTTEEIFHRRDKAMSRLKKSFGLSFDDSDFHRFRSIFRVDRSELPQQFGVFRSKWVPELLSHIAAPLDNYKIEVDFASEDAYWKSWISGELSQHRIKLQINIHPRQLWYRGSAEALVIHEYCAHAVQMVSWHRQIEEKRLAEFLGILTVHFPDQFLLEGLAESLIYFLPDENAKLEPMSVVQRDLHDYVLSVMNNLHVLANENNPDEAFEYARQLLPFTEEDVIRKEIRDRTTNPLFRCYQYVYAIAKESFLGALKPLDSDQQWDLLRSVYASPMTARQFKQNAARLNGREQYHS